MIDMQDICHAVFQHWYTIAIVRERAIFTIQNPFFQLFVNGLSLHHRH